jgi:hypothetical protein
VSWVIGNAYSCHLLLVKSFFRAEVEKWVLFEEKSGFW